MTRRVLSHQEAKSFYDRFGRKQDLQRFYGGCRPLELAAFLGPEWNIVHREVVCTFGICTEVLIAAV